MAMGGLLLELVVPVYNEERSLEASIVALVDALRGQFDERWLITIADNASTDATGRIGAGLAERFDRVRIVRLDEKGRGRALKQVWLASEAAVVAYVDVDLSTDLAALSPLVAPLLSGHSDVAIGTRLDRRSRVVRGTKRELISRCYNGLIRAVTGARFSDAQCGFKAMRTDVARVLLPNVIDTGWFFDSELLIIAEEAGLRIHEVPVDWIDDVDSKVDIVATARADLFGLVRVVSGITTGRIPVSAIRAEFGRRPLGDSRTSFFGQVVRFAAVGVASTAAYAVLYLMLRSVVTPQAANAIALLLTAVANTWANGRFTFGTVGTGGAVLRQARGLVVFGVAWGITSGALAGQHLLAPHAHPVEQLAVLTAANLLATIVRFAAMRLWVFRRSARGVRRTGVVEAPAVVR